MEVEKLAIFAGFGFALAVGAFVLWGPSPKPRRRGQIVGITNLGYTCFLNSLLQALASCPTFVFWLQKQNEDKKSCFAKTLLTELTKINGFSDEVYGDVVPIDIISSLGPLWNFAPGHQDTHELFHVVLGALQAELQPVNRKGCLSDALPATSPVADIKDCGDLLGFRSVSCMDISQSETNVNGIDKHCNGNANMLSQSITNVSTNHIRPGMILARSSEIIPIATLLCNGDNEAKPWSSLCAIPATPTLSNEVHPFSGLLTSQLQCTDCKWKSSVRYDKLESVSLPLPPAGLDNNRRMHTLTELLSRLVSCEVINDVECDGCEMRCPAFKTLTFGKLPKCLCLHIPRTTWSSSGVPVKRDDPVIFSEVLVLDPFTYTETKRRSTQGHLQTMAFLNNLAPTHGKHRYILRAVVEHRGPVDSGHFVCYRRSNRPGQWLYTSDTTVESVSLAEVLFASPYLLFYERVNSQHERHS